MEKGSAWWSDEIKEAVQEEKSAHKKMILQRNVTEEEEVRES